MTFSHRWAGKGVIKTTVATVSARKTGIPIRDLPQTFAHVAPGCRMP
jgi:hypothetical protein